MADVVLENLRKTFRGVAAVDGVDLHVPDGELLVLVGPSGCGKTTTLRMIAGLDEPTAGEIRIGGRSVRHLAPKDRHVAMVFQHFALYPHLDVCRNLAFGLKLRRVPRSEIEPRVRDAEVGEHRMARLEEHVLGDVLGKPHEPAHQLVERQAVDRLRAELHVLGERLLEPFALRAFDGMRVSGVEQEQTQVIADIKGVVALRTGKREQGIVRYNFNKSLRKNQRNTATAIVVVQRPFLSPSADWQVFFVLMIFPLAL